MGWDEKIFRASLNAIRSLLNGKQKVSPEDSYKVLLTDILPRLKILASAIAGRSIEIKEAETIGGPIGDTLFLPASIALAVDHELNRNAYLYRVVYSVTLARLGKCLSNEHRDDSYAQLLASLLMVPIVRKELAEHYAGLMTTEKILLAAEAKRLNQITSESPRFRALHAFALLLLNGMDPEKLSSDKWEKKAFFAANSLEIESSAKTMQALLSRLRYLPTTRENPLVLMPLIWGLVLPLNSPMSKGKSTRNEAPSSKGTSLPTGTERKGRPKERVEEVKLTESKEDENPLVHVFEKVRTVDDYLGGKKMLDGSDELEEQLEAIQELDLRNMIRSRERTESIYKADVSIDGGIGDLADEDTVEAPTFFYDEWDFRARRHKKNWCKIFLDTRVETATSVHSNKIVSEILQKNARQVRDLRRQFEELTYVRKWRTRQPDGPEIDLDAVVDRYATLKSGHSPSPYLYLSQRPKDRDYATLVLLDSSLSTDSWLQNRRVMDVMKESMLVLGEVVAEFRDRMAIGAFYSNTRNDCRYIEVKGFNESWKSCQAKLMGLHPTGYTRIGPALRHGTHLLRQVKAKKKLMLLISDGKPTDYDRYEGLYGIEDIRQAVREASKDNVIVRALAVESQAKFYLPQMFGNGNFQILPNPEMLAGALAKIYGWLST